MAKEYIERESLFNTFQLAAKASDAMGRHDSAGIYASAASLVADQPSADVVPVVRCGECIHRVNMEHSMDNKEICCGRMAMRVMALDDYCSHGVRMDGGEHHAD